MAGGDDCRELEPKQVKGQSWPVWAGSSAGPAVWGDGDPGRCTVLVNHFCS